MAATGSAAAAVIVACWGALIVVWIAAAVYFGRRSSRVQRRAVGPWVPAVIIVVALVALSRLDWSALQLQVWWIQLIGGALLIVSTAFAIWARLSLGAMWSASAVAREHHELRVSGPYAVTRHPIYTGLIGMLLGTTLLSGFGIWIPFLVAGTVLFWAKAASEERLLRGTFGDAYARYRERVPGLIPMPRLAGPRKSA